MIPQAVNYSPRSIYGNIYRDVPDTIGHPTFPVYRLDKYGVATGDKESREQSLTIEE